MKKIISVLVIASMILSLGVIVPAAADIEGDWMTYRQANDYHEVDPETGEEPAYKAAPGYMYTEEGFTTIPADYTGTSPYFNVQSKEKQSLKDGVYLEFRVDDFSYRGEDSMSDEWINISLWDTVNIAPGQTNHGSGWFVLLRGEGGGTAVNVGQCATIQTTEEATGYSNLYDSATDVNPELDDEGREIYTLEVEWVDDKYVISICGVTLGCSQQTTELLEGIDKNGEFYVGVSFHSGAKDGKAAMTILKYGESKESATTPLGTDSKEPEVNNNIVADMMDPNEIPANQPGIYWDASLYSTPATGSLDMVALGDNGYRVIASASACFFGWNVRKDISYAAEDFPVVAMMVRDFWNSGVIWYYSGDHVSLVSGQVMSFDAFSGVTYEGEFENYALIIVDLTDCWEGRINGFRVDFAGIDLENPEFDICYMGCFRSWEEAEAYGATYLGVEVTTDEEVSTEAPTQDAGGNEVTEEPTEKVDDGESAPVTEAPGGTSVTPGTDNNGQNQGNNGSGCSSIVGLGSISILVLIAAWFVKKKE